MIILNKFQEPSLVWLVDLSLHTTLGEGAKMGTLTSNDHIGFSTQKRKTNNLHNTRKNKQPNNCNHIFWLNVNNLLRWYCSYEKNTISSNIGIDHPQWHHWDPLRTSLHDHVSHACQYDKLLRSHHLVPMVQVTHQLAIRGNCTVFWFFWGQIIHFTDIAICVCKTSSAMENCSCPGVLADGLCWWYYHW